MRPVGALTEFLGLRLVTGASSSNEKLDEREVEREFLRGGSAAQAAGRDIMSGSSTFQGLSLQAVEEHRQIHFYLDQISQTLRGLRGDPADLEQLRRLAAQIEGLKERLVEHHEAEEKGGLFQAIVEALPSCRVEIDRLTNQHGRMIEILEMARLHALGIDVSQAEGLREDLERFLDTFRQHEKDEERLLERATEKESKAVD